MNVSLLSCLENMKNKYINHNMIDIRKEFIGKVPNEILLDGDFLDYLRERLLNNEMNGNGVSIFEITEKEKYVLMNLLNYAIIHKNDIYNYNKKMEEEIK